MNTQLSMDRDKKRIQINKREQLLAGIPVTERRLNLAGISTTILEGGVGPPIILLHGPGETAIWWMRVIPKLVTEFRVIVPDLPGHGESRVNIDKLDTDVVFSWLSALIEQTCSSPPALVGNILGGSIGARFAIHRGEQISHLVLVDSLGLGKFRPAPSFAFGLFRFMIWPNEKNFNRFFPHCIYDVDALQTQMGEKWDPFVAYNLECARDKERGDAVQFLMKTLGIPKIPDKELEKINVPTTLIWGRHDKANKLKIAEAASKNYGWPLHVIENTRDDPKLEQPDIFVKTLLKTVNTKRNIS